MPITDITHRFVKLRNTKMQEYIWEITYVKSHVTGLLPACCYSTSSSEPSPHPTTTSFEIRFNIIQ
jgi:hypothetical protein